MIYEAALISLESARAIFCPDSSVTRPFCCIIGVSGGADSMVLMDVLASILSSNDIENLKLVVCHVDHGLRPESKDEAEFVKAQAKKRGLLCEVYSFDGLLQGKNLEDWARQVRYSAFKKCKKKHNAHCVLTAHHEADQAETLLWRLCSGRLKSSAHTIALVNKERGICRPLLFVPKKEITNYIDSHNIKHVFDSSNLDLKRTRNILRLEVLPKLRETINPSLDSALTATAARLNEDEEALWASAKRVTSLTQKPLSLMASFFNDLAPAIAWRSLCLRAENQVGSVARQISVANLKKVVEFSKKGKGFGPLDLGFGVSCFALEDTGIKFQLKSHKRLNYITYREDFLIPGELTLCHSAGMKSRLVADCFNSTNGQGELSAEKIKEVEGDPYFKAKAFFDLRLLDTDKLVVRSWSPGDAMRVWKRGRRKVKKLFQEISLSHSLRHELPIIELNGELLWIPGVARSESAPIVESTTKVLALTYYREN